MSELTQNVIRANFDETRDGIELNEKFMVLAAPENTLEVTISAKVWHNGEVIEVRKTMSLDEVRKAFKDADENYIPEDAVFTLGPAGKEYLDRLKAEQLAKFGDA